MKKQALVGLLALGLITGCATKSQKDDKKAEFKRIPKFTKEKEDNSWKLTASYTCKYDQVTGKFIHIPHAVQKYKEEKTLDLAESTFSKSKDSEARLDKMVKDFMGGHTRGIGVGFGKYSYSFQEDYNQLQQKYDNFLKDLKNLIEKYEGNKKR